MTASGGSDDAMASLLGVFSSKKAAIEAATKALKEADENCLKEMNTTIKERGCLFENMNCALRGIGMDTVSLNSAAATEWKDAREQMELTDVSGIWMNPTELVYEKIGRAAKRQKRMQ